MSKKFSHVGGDNISLQNVGVSSKMRESWQVWLGKREINW